MASRNIFTKIYLSCLSAVLDIYLFSKNITSLVGIIINFSRVREQAWCSNVSKLDPSNCTKNFFPPQVDTGFYENV